jgi:hypothetical protein
MKDISIRKGETLAFELSAPDTDAVSAVFTVKKTAASLTVALVQEANFVDGWAFFEFDETETMLELGDYVYQIKVNYSSGSEIWPGAGRGCEDDDCSLPKFKVCESTEGGIS